MHGTSNCHLDALTQTYQPSFIVIGMFPYLPNHHYKQNSRFAFPYFSEVLRPHRAPIKSYEKEADRLRGNLLPYISRICFCLESTLISNKHLMCISLISTTLYGIG